MNYIIFDLEFNQPFKTSKVTKQLMKCSGKSDLPQEIIEIGAIKTDENFEVIDTFRIFVKPEVYKNIHPRVANITKITREDLEYAFPFKQSINYFKRWIEDNYIFCTWGTDDIRELRKNCQYYNIEKEWINKFINVQKLYMLSLRSESNKLVSLKQAISDMSIAANESNHRALNDSNYTLKILRKIKNVDINNNIENSTNTERIEIDYLSDKRINRNKLKRRCPNCGKFISPESQWLEMRKGIQSLGFCKNCNQFILCKIIIILKDNQINYYAKNQIITKEKSVYLKDKFLQKEEILCH